MEVLGTEARSSLRATSVASHESFLYPPLSRLMENEAVDMEQCLWGKCSVEEKRDGDGDTDLECWSCSPGDMTHQYPQEIQLFRIPPDAVLWLALDDFWGSLTAILCFSSWFVPLSAEHLLALPVFS